MDEYIERESVSADGCDEVRKIKTPFAWIIVDGTADKPYYSILWWDTEKKECNVGYSSYYLKYVFNWLKENFEITEEDADVAPVRHGYWILEVHKERVNCRWNVTAECSECCDEEKEIWEGFFPGVPDSMAREIALMDAEQVKLSNFCKNCGARMDGDCHADD